MRLRELPGVQRMGAIAAALASRGASPAYAFVAGAAFLKQCSPPGLATNGARALPKECGRILEEIALGSGEENNPWAVRDLCSAYRGLRNGADIQVSAVSARCWMMDVNVDLHISHALEGEHATAPDSWISCSGMAIRLMSSRVAVFHTAISHQSDTVAIHHVPDEGGGSRNEVKLCARSTNGQWAGVMMSSAI